MSTQPQSQNQPKENAELSSVSSGATKNEPARKSLNDFQPILQARFEILESIRSVISVKFFDRILAKLKQEEMKAAELSGASRDKQKHQERYSHVLDPQYFEQRFL